MLSSYGERVSFARAPSQRNVVVSKVNRHRSNPSEARQKKRSRKKSKKAGISTRSMKNKEIVQPKFLEGGSGVV